MRTENDALHTSANGERRARVIGDRVACRRIGPAEVQRCAECVYLVRLGKKFIVCLEEGIPDQPDFAW